MSQKLALPAFLKVFTSASVPMAKAMEYAAKIYKTHNSPEQLAALADASLVTIGILKKEDRKQILQAVRKSGFKTTTTSQSGSTPKPRKRKRDDDLNDMLPSGPREEGSEFKTLEFKEILDETEMVGRTAFVNRAPVMTAWSMTVAGRLGFKHEEALSIASVYTEMNAISKGLSLGIYEKGKGKGVEVPVSASQPYVELMGRRPLYKTRNGEWRALSQSCAVAPSTAYSYISRSFRQTAPYILGAMRLLADTFPPVELNKHGFSLYADFRPTVEQWGGRSEITCAKILELRRPVKDKTESEIAQASVAPEISNPDAQVAVDEAEEGGTAKKQKTLSLEDYENAFDEIDDAAIAEVDLRSLSQ